MLKQQRMAAVAGRIEQLDSEVAKLAAEGYMLDVDRLLEERRHLEWTLCALEAGLVPNGLTPTSDGWTCGRLRSRVRVSRTRWRSPRARRDASRRPPRRAAC